MLQTVTIQNFKSLRDVTVRLQKVNLLIGPNNSGKSNFLKALATLKDCVESKINPNTFDFSRTFHKQQHQPTVINKKAIRLGLYWHNMQYEGANNALYQIELYGYAAGYGDALMYNEAFGNYRDAKIPFDFVDLQTAYKQFQHLWVAYRHNYPKHSNTSILAPIYRHLEKQSSANAGMLAAFLSGELTVSQWGYDVGRLLGRGVQPDIFLDFDLAEALRTIRIYKPEPSKIAKESLLLFDKHVNEDCSNLVAFLDNMRDEHPNVWKAIERDLNKCIPDFEGINFGKVTIKSNLNVEGRTESIGKRFGLRDKHGKTYWADELSEGTIYFLALLAIVHQPNPPKVLLLEEPEKGIHPRRIAEVMDLIFRLAEEKDIQIILTSHSTQVVDAFQDIPESVFVFDMVDGETKIKNLQTDILESDAKDAQQKNFPKIDYSKRSLGEHWAIGLLGGVPV